MSLCLFWSLAHNWMEEANLSTTTHSANHKWRMLEKVKVSPFEMCCSGKEQLSIWVFFFYASSVHRQAIVFHASSVGHGKLLPSTTVATSLQSVSPNNYQKSLTREIIFSLATRGYQGLANQSADLCQWGLMRLMHKLHRWIKTQFNGHKKTKSNLS